MTPVGMILTAIACFGLLVARWAIGRSSTRSAVALRLGHLYALLAVLLTVRLAMAAMSSPLLSVLLMVVAAWLPLAGLRLVEELRRRHAPVAIKLAGLLGAIGFSVVAVTAGFFWSHGAMLALAAYQAAMLAAMIVLLATGRRSIGGAERHSADIVLLALLLAIPLAASDFTALLPDLPVRGGPFAILLLVLATSRLIGGDGHPAQLLGDIGVAAGAGGVAVFAGMASLPRVPPQPDWRVAAAGAATAMLVLLIERLSRLRARQRGLVAALAGSLESDADAMLSAHSLLSSGRLLTDAELSTYPEASLARLLEHRVVNADTSDAEARDAARDLLDAAGATHLLRVSRNPPRLLAIAAGPLAGPALDDELAIAARLLEAAR